MQHQQTGFKALTKDRNKSETKVRGYKDAKPAAAGQV